MACTRWPGNRTAPAVLKPRGLHSLLALARGVVRHDSKLVAAGPSQRGPLAARRSVGCGGRECGAAVRGGRLQAAHDATGARPRPAVVSGPPANSGPTCRRAVRWHAPAGPGIGRLPPSSNPVVSTAFSRSRVELFGTTRNSSRQDPHNAVRSLRAVRSAVGVANVGPPYVGAAFRRPMTPRAHDRGRPL